MAFALSTVISVVTDGAQRAVSRLSNSITHLSKETDRANKRAGSSWSRLGSELAKTSLISSGLFAGLIASSPQLQAALTLLAFEFREIGMALGDELAPIISDVLLPAMQVLTDTFLALPAPIRTVIAVTIGLTVAVGALSVAVGVLSAVSWPIVAIIAAIVIIVTALVWIFKKATDKTSFFNKVLRSMGEGLKTIFMFMLNIIGKVFMAIMNFAESMSRFNWVEEVFIPMGTAIGDFFQALGEAAYNWGVHLIKNFIQGIQDKWDASWDVIEDIASDIGDYISFSSPPPKGALSSIDSWGVHAVERLTASWKKGMNMSFLPMMNQTTNFAPPMPALTGSPIGGGGTTVNFDIKIENPIIRSEHDIDELSNQVRDKILRDLNSNSRGVWQ